MTTPSPEAPPVAICAGNDCAKDERTRFKALVAALEGLDVARTKCLDVCDGPVAVLDPAGEKPVVVEGIKSKHAPKVAKHARHGTRPKDGSKLNVVTKKKKREKAIRKARAHLGS